MKKKVILLAIFVCSLAALLAVSAFAADIVDSGNCGKNGDNVTYTLDSDGLLTISGEGEMGDYSYSNRAPWYDRCEEIKKVAILDGVTSIGNSAFSYCSNLTSIEIPNSVMSIGDSAFTSCSSLTSIEIPNSVTNIGDYAFESCSSLTSIKIPSSVTSIGDRVFSFCSSLTNIEIPNSVTSIGDYAFESCSSLTSIKIPSSVTSIGDRVFSYCSSLTIIEIPNGMTNIGNAAFFYCSSLTSIKIPNSVKRIEDEAFRNCNRLKNVYFGGTAKEWYNIYIDKYGNDCLLNAAIHYSTPTVNGVTIMAIEDTNINDKTVLVVENVASEDLPQTAKEAIGEKKHIAYDITLENSGAKVQPSGKVRVELTPPDSYNLENCIVYHIKEDGTLENMNAVIKNGRLCFETDHLNVYMIIDTSEYTVGDTDGDGAITSADAVLLAQYLANWKTKINLSAADVNGDGEVTAKDSVLLAQYLAGWDIKLGK